MCAMDNAPTLRVAANVRAELARLRKSQSDLAGHLGISRPAVSFRLSGQTPMNINELVRIAEFLGVPLDRLTDGADTKVGAA